MDVNEKQAKDILKKGLEKADSLYEKLPFDNMYDFNSLFALGRRNFNIFIAANFNLSFVFIQSII